ncbi:MAG: electron transfer flavoprotein subunit alpha/FixB family protein [Gammaproteobacteria bacterium]|nr:electron transfer flavoprotein subunit alpha/FixB family protein [Gammaproteobacteria bacterium]MDH3768734.1 electron transfer flavoprotein subunit alpha/FixB family protein [Gammaproteobacteria bacterium]
MTKVLLVAEHDGAQLNLATAKALSCATQIGETDVVVFCDGANAVCDAAAKLSGAQRILKVSRSENAKPLAAVFAPQIAEMAADYTHILVPSTTFGKDIQPRVAALLGAPQVSDIMSVEGPRKFKRPIYAGNVIVTIDVPEAAKVVGTVRTASFKAADGGASAEVVNVSVDTDLPTHTRYIALEAHASERPDLQSANRVVSGGRGVGSAENFALIYSLADKIGAAAGASRAAVDAGYVPNDMQVGQTGKIIAPDLYIAVGISGAIQHLTGIKDAGTIVAINKDGEAPIFGVADLGLVGDLFAIVPELEKQLG